MKNTVISDFKEWFENNEQQWKDRSEQAIFKANESKAIVEITGKCCLASITVWDMGACDTLALSTVTNKEIWIEHYNFQDFKKVIGSLERFTSFLTDCNAATQI